jgi:hypothetical protein
VTLVKKKLRNKMGHSLLDDCLVTYIEYMERDTFLEVDEDNIIDTFMSLRERRLQKSNK